MAGIIPASSASVRGIRKGARAPQSVRPLTRLVFPLAVLRIRDQQQPRVYLQSRARITVPPSCRVATNPSPAFDQCSRPRTLRPSGAWFWRGERPRSLDFIERTQLQGLAG
jgi:hypothetical protein